VVQKALECSNIRGILFFLSLAEIQKPRWRAKRKNALWIPGSPGYVRSSFQHTPWKTSFSCIVPKISVNPMGCIQRWRFRVSGVLGRMTAGLSHWQRIPHIMQRWNTSIFNSSLSEIMSKRERSMWNIAPREICLQISWRKDSPTNCTKGYWDWWELDKPLRHHQLRILPNLAKILAWSHPVGVSNYGATMREMERLWITRDELRDMDYPIWNIRYWISEMKGPW